MSEPKLEATGVFIPMSVWNHVELSWLEKAMISEIKRLSVHRDTCVVNNEQIAETMGSTAGNVAVSISKFRKLGLVKDISGTTFKRCLQCCF